MYEHMPSGKKGLSFSGTHARARVIHTQTHTHMHTLGSYIYQTYIHTYVSTHTHTTQGVLRRLCVRVLGLSCGVRASGLSSVARPLHTQAARHLWHMPTERETLREMDNTLDCLVATAHTHTRSYVITHTHIAQAACS